MRKSWNTLILIALAIALATIPSTFFYVRAQRDDEPLYASLGVSNLNITGFVNQTETKEFEVGRIYNTGDFNLTITLEWISENSSGVNVEIIPSQIYLAPDDAKTIHAKVLGVTVGNYSGSISATSKVELPPDYQGNPTTPGGQINARFVVLHKEVQVDQSVSESFPIISVVIGVGSILSIIIFVIFIVKRYKRQQVKQN